MKKLFKSIMSVLIIVLLMTVELLSGTADAAALPILKDNINSTGFLSTIPNKQIPNVNLKPAQLKNVQYIYQRDVKRVDLTQYYTREGMIKPPGGTVIAPGTILVDENVKNSLYVLGKNADGTLIVRRPTMNEVFENFEIPEQTVAYNPANIIDLQPAIHNARIGMESLPGMGTITIKYVPQFNASPGDYSVQKLASFSGGNEQKAVEDALKGGWSHSFDKAVLDAYLADGTKLSIKLSGEIALNMTFDTKYTAFKGYKFGINGAEKLKLKAALDVKVNQEVYIPIVGIDIPFSIGRIRAGLFVVVGVNGDITLVVLGEEGMSFSAGVKGGTWFAVPTSFGTYGEHHSYYATECDPNGQITAYTYLTPTVSLEALGIDVVKAELRLGFKVHAIKNDTLLDYGMSAVAQFYAAILGEGTNIFYKEVSLFSRQKEAPPGGFFFYADLCAYRDDVVAAVFRAKKAGEALPGDMDPFADKLPYTGGIDIYYYRGDTTKPYKVINTSISPEDKGILKYNFKEGSGIDVVKGDSIRIVVPNNPEAISKHTFSTMPFKGIKLDKADFFNEIAFGQVEPAGGIRDMPGWANTIVKTDNINQLIYCKGRTAEIRLVDPTNRTKTITKTAVTDSEGKFIVKSTDRTLSSNIDIRPYRKAIPYINIDGFEIEGNPIDTTAGIYFVMGTDYRTNYVGKKLVKESDGTSKVVTVNTLDELAHADQIISVESTSGDHFIAVNKYGTKKINNNIDYNTNAYYVENIDFILNMAEIMASQGNTVDLRERIMDDGKKQLVYNEHAVLTCNEGNNSQIELFKGNAANEADTAIESGQPVSSSHAYHRILVRNGRYARDAISLRIPAKPTGTVQRKVSNITVETFKGNSPDITDPLQQKGVDATVTLNVASGEVDNGFASSIVYIDTNATMDIEGYKLKATQADPWIIKGKRHTTGTTPEQKLKDEIEGFMKDGPIYFKRFVINPFENTRYNTWKPAANQIKHELIIDYMKGTMTIDGIRVNNTAKGSMVNGKLYLPVVSLTKMMGGISSFDAISKKLTLNAGGRSIVLNTSSKTAVISGKTISLSSGALGTGSDLQINTDTIASLFGAGVNVDTKAQNVKISFTGN